MFLSKTYAVIVTFAVMTGLVDAFWRMSCSVIQTGRIDPVISPGVVSSHVHKIVGASSKYNTCRPGKHSTARDELQVLISAMNNPDRQSSQ